MDNPETEHHSGATAVGDAGAAPSLLDQVMAATAPQTFDEQTRLAAFLAERSPQAALALWVEGRVPAAGPATLRGISQLLSRDIARIDAAINRQLNAILHHPRFQKLESTWRGLTYLLEHADPERNIKVRVLNATWAELTRDMERAVEFDQSALFQKVYSDEFGVAGGEPFGMLIGDYEVRHRPAADHPTDDLSTLTAISGVAAAAFAPFICAADPVLLGVDHFGQLERPMDLTATFDQVEYTRWKSFRQLDDARFIGLALPRVLMRLPHGEDSTRTDFFCFKEEVAGPDQRNYLWGNAAWALGGVVLRAFADFGWMADIRGFRRGEQSGGIVSDLPVCSFAMDAGDIGTRFSTEVLISDPLEKELGNLGFIPLCHSQYSDDSVFYSNASANKPKVYNEALATVNARISGMLQYVLCVSRFSHYLKVQARSRIGGFTEPQELEDRLSKWLNEYTADDNNSSAEVRARFPLREASVQIREHPEKPGTFLCVMQLCPHYQMDTMSAGIRLTTEMAPANSR